VPRFYSKFLRGVQAKWQVKKLEQLKYFLVPLQLCRDFQVREHSDFNGMPDFIRHIIAEFTLHAPANTHIVIKKHPLDPGLMGLRKIAIKAAASAGIKDRMIFLDGGNLPALIKNSLGVITVNSTAGLQAVHHKAPVLLLGRSFYAIDDLVNKVDIKTFLNNPQKPDDKLYKHFRNYVMRKTQVNGGFYNQPGIDLAVAGIIKKLVKQNKSESLPANYPGSHDSQKVS
jgi:capsular polysaccharide export protein